MNRLNTHAQRHNYTQTHTHTTHLIKVGHGHRLSKVPVLFRVHRGPPPFAPPLDAAVPLPHNTVVQRPRVVKASLALLQVGRPRLEVLILTKQESCCCRYCCRIENSPDLYIY